MTDSYRATGNKLAVASEMLELLGGEGCVKYQVVTVTYSWNLHLLKLFWIYSTGKHFDKVMTVWRQDKLNNG